MPMNNFMYMNKGDYNTKTNKTSALEDQRANGTEKNKDVIEEKFLEIEKDLNLLTEKTYLVPGKIDTA